MTILSTLASGIGSARFRWRLMGGSMLSGMTPGMVLTIPIRSYFTPLAPTQASHGRLTSR